MDFDSLIPILFVTIWILSVIFGAKKKKAGADPKKSPLKTAIGKVLQQMKNELEQKSENAGKGNSVWDLLAGKDADQQDLELSLTLPPDEEGGGNRQTPPAVPDQRPRERTASSHPPPIPESKFRAKRLARQRMLQKTPAAGTERAGKPLQTDLEKAVIWSEILGPPRAFREL